MITFYEYLSEAAGKGLQGNTNSIKTKGHIKRYIFPFLSAEQKKQSIKNLGDYFSEKDIADSKHKEDGSLHNPDLETTHTLASKIGNNDKGGGVKVTGVYRNGNIIMAKTASHGDIPISKLGTPSELAGEQKTKKGFELEGNLQRNADPTRKPAGSTKTAYDFSAGDISDDNKSVRGKAVKSDETPFLRGEAKASKKGTVAMGTSELKYDPKTKKWGITNESLSDIFSKATVNGVPLLDHLNKNHSNGVIDKGFTATAHPGTALEYLRSSNANALHLHRYAQNEKGETTMDHGTTYTIGDANPFKDKLGMGHLGEDDLLKLDGRLNIEKSRPGSGGSATTTVKHRPSATTFNALADASKNDPSNHLNLNDDTHGEQFRKRFSDTLKEFERTGAKSSLSGSAFKSNSSMQKPSPMQIATQLMQNKKVEHRPPPSDDTHQIDTMMGEGGREPPEKANHGGYDWHTPQEQSLMKRSK